MVLLCRRPQRSTLQPVLLCDPPTYERLHPIHHLRKLHAYQLTFLVSAAPAVEHTWHSARSAPSSSSRAIPRTLPATPPPHGTTAVVDIILFQIATQPPERCADCLLDSTSGIHGSRAFFTPAGRLLSVERASTVDVKVSAQACRGKSEATCVL